MFALLNYFYPCIILGLSLYPPSLAVLDSHEQKPRGFAAFIRTVQIKPIYLYVHLNRFEVANPCTFPINTPAIPFSITLFFPSL